MTAMEQIEPTLETVRPGDGFAREYRLTSDAYPDYFDAGAVDWSWLRLADGRVATPHSVAFEDGNRTFSQRYLSGRKLNAHIRHVFYAPLLQPLEVADSVDVERTYIRRGREHVEFLALVRDAEGRVLMASENDWVMNSAVRHAEDSPPDAYATPRVSALPPRQFTMPASEGARALRVGDELPSLERRAWLWDPPGGHGPNSVHGDEYARRVLGTRGAIVLGSSILGYVYEVLGRALGPSWLERGALDARFVAPIVRDDLVTAHARVSAVVRDAEGEHVNFEVWVANAAEDERTSIVGTASYCISERA